MDILLKKRVDKIINNCHEASRSFIDIVTEAGIKQMTREGIRINPYNIDDINPKEIALYGAKYIGVEESKLEEFIDEYIILMVFEKMIEI